MRLLELYVEKYRVLERLTIDFGRDAADELTESLQPGYRLDFLVGLNGSGKSTVLHLLSRIFQNVFSDQGSFSETVELKYSINGSTVKITNRVADQPESELETPTNIGGSFRFEVIYPNGSHLESQTRLPAELRPTQVITYTTGSEIAWLRELQKNSKDVSTDNLSADHVINLYEMPGHQRIMSDTEQEDGVVSPLLFVPSQRLPLVTLCGLIASRKYDAEKEILKPTLESMNLEKLVGFSLRLRPEQSWTNVDRPDVVNKLEEIADHKIQQGADRLLVFNFDRDKPDLQQILNLYSTPIEIYQRLNQLCENDRFHTPPLQDVSLFFRALPTDPLIPKGETSTEQSLYLYDWLSDGERSFLGRMALFSLCRADNMLIMLDEPEVHFNDAWKREIVNMLHGIMKDQSSHALITTHSSIALTDVPKESILVLRRAGRTTEGRNAEPNINTLGADPSDVLVHVFGTGSAAGRRSATYIGTKIAESASEKDLEKLEAIVAPGYWRYRIELEKQRLQPSNR